MNQALFFKTILFFGLLWICSSSAIAQTPAPDLDSITEDSYRRMLGRQEGEQGDMVYPNFVAPDYDTSLEIYTVADVPSPRGTGIIGSISDPKDIIDFASEQRINELLYELEQKSSVEVAVVMLPSIGQDVPKSFAVDLFNEWKIGKADTDNGLLILTVMDQRRTEFEVGYGLEGILTDVVCYRIGVNEIVPYFKQGNFGGGIESAVLRVKEFLENPETIDEVYGYSVVHEEQEFEWQWYHFLLILYGAICLIMGFWYFGQAFDIQLSKDDYYDKYHRLHKLKFGCTDILFPLPMLFFARMAKSRLEKYRYASRFSKKNGKPMTLLTNYDEIDYLEEVQLLEEELKSILYDVWITEDRSDIMILEYEGPNGRKYSDCKECGYKTFGKINSLILVFATYDRGGTRIDKYECRNCNYKEEKEVQTPQKSRPSESSSSSGSSFSSSSSSSSSSSFGGGSSGGGGAGVSW
ncbi:TPM domain-containing protein [Maribacter algarum]|uniref:TPM domain-containing protein n=1 Tax=Maribacter algarum (ex Zhang et al. 2020) TaxID=2578118 RepID=A0A5S3QI10_9FLAO|nr:TPM domain-containing protein [Maribacter algarum]TMM57175.1 TPM domain-containing protein [Maribacter algarum]